VAAPVALIEGPLRRSAWIWGSLALATAALSLLAGFVLARLLTTSFGRLQEAANALGNGKSLPPRQATMVSEAATVHEVLEASRNEIDKREQLLRESETRLAALLAQMPCGVGLMDRDGKWIIANPTMRRFMPEQIASRDSQRVGRWCGFDADGRPLDPEHWPNARALRGEVVHPGIELTYTTNDGQELWTRVAAAPFRTSKGELSGAVAMVEDITQQKAAEDRLHRQSALIAAVNDSTSE
jgi:PAS domain-containing protein